MTVMPMENSMERKKPRSKAMNSATNLLNYSEMRRLMTTVMQKVN